MSNSEVIASTHVENSTVSIKSQVISDNSVPRYGKGRAVKREVSLALNGLRIHGGHDIVVSTTTGDLDVRGS